MNNKKTPDEALKDLFLLLCKELGIVWLTEKLNSFLGIMYCNIGSHDMHFVRTQVKIADFGSYEIHQCDRCGKVKYL